MSIVRNRPFGQGYAFVVAGVIFACLLAAACLRAAPGVLILPVEKAFGWSRADLSLAAAVGILLYGLTGPFAAALMQTLGLKRTVIGALVLMAAAMGLSAFVTAPWQLILTWGVLSGLASGAIASVLAATVVNRWFVKDRGLVMGLLTASAATGTLIFLPALAALAEAKGWSSVVLAVAAAALVLVPVVILLVPERPADIGQAPWGGTELIAGHAGGGALARAFGALAEASKSPAFWLLAGTFFICGFTTNGLVGTHMIALCADHGLPEVRAAGVLALMGLFDLVGTTASGWLTDRIDPRKLLFAYYGLRGLSLIWLPYSDFSLTSLTIFAAFYGLDWIATVPPTLKLANARFGDEKGPVVFGWIAAAHQVGAASAAFLAGVLRAAEGRYLEAFVVAGLTGLIAAAMALMIGRSPVRAGAAAAAE
jgi:predicted MFS family arabinose efflux permease